MIFSSFLVIWIQKFIIRIHNAIQNNLYFIRLIDSLKVEWFTKNVRRWTHKWIEMFMRNEWFLMELLCIAGSMFDLMHGSLSTEIY